MARIRPFAGWRYARVGGELTPVVCPPYDVISREQRDDLLRRHPDNAVAIELPYGEPDPAAENNRYQTGKLTWDRMRADGTLQPDALPAVYVLEQHYAMDGREIHRRAFIAEAALEPFEAGIVIPHERTLPKALGDRFELIKATGANFSQVFGLFDDPAHETDALFEGIMRSTPVATATDDEGVVSTLWMSDDPEVTSTVTRMFSEKQIFIADGHHRYTTALAYRDLKRKQAAEKGEAPVDPAYDFVMMALVNMDDDDLVVLPTHRVVDGIGFDAEKFKTQLAEEFVLEPVEGDPDRALDGVEEPALLVRTKTDAVPFRARLRPDIDVDEVIALDRSHAWKTLDVAVLQELILDPLLGVHPDRPETLDRLKFFKDRESAWRALEGHDVAFVLRSTRMDQLRAIALAGETMPQKSTYFYPKLMTGLVFRSAE
jgi:uncharacterized protein (DUF1015 family)